MEPASAPAGLASRTGGCPAGSAAPSEDRHAPRSPRPTRVREEARGPRASTGTLPHQAGRVSERADPVRQRGRLAAYPPRAPARPAQSQLAPAISTVREMRVLVARLRLQLLDEERERPTAAEPARGRAVALRATLGIAVGVLLVFVFLRLVRLSAVLGQLSHLHVGFALLSGVAFLAAYVVRAVRWRCLLNPVMVSVRRLAAIYQVATFLNWLLPVQAGELAKSLLLRRTDRVPVSQSLATVSMDRSMDLLPAIVLIGLAPFAHLHLSRPLWIVLLLASAGVALALLGVAIAALARQRASRLLSGLLGPILPRGAGERVEPLIGTFLDTLAALARRRSALVVAAALTAGAVCLDALFCLLAFRAVGLHVSPLVALYGYTMFNLAFILPTPPGHVGSNELIGLLIFAGVFGLDRAGVAAMFLFAHPWTAILITVSGLACLSRLGVRFSTAFRFAVGDGAEGHR